MNDYQKSTEGSDPDETEIQRAREHVMHVYQSAQNMYVLPIPSSNRCPIDGTTPA